MKDQMNKPLEGYFALDMFDKNGKKIYHYEDSNQIMNQVGVVFSNYVLGNNPALVVDSAQLGAIVVGSNGVTSDGTPKIIDPKREKLFSEYNYWDSGKKTPQDSYLYQSTFDIKTIDAATNVVTLLKEGSNYDSKGIETAAAYMGTPTTANKELGSNLFARVTPGKVVFIYEIKKLSGIGSHKFSEAALYMKLGAKPDGNPLGTIFSMKTFPEVEKTNACLLQLTWTIDFNLA